MTQDHIGFTHMRLRIEGWSLQEIADRDGITKEMVHKVVLAGLRNERAPAAADYRALYDARLEAIWKVLHPLIMAGDYKAIDRGIRVLERLALMHGADLPKRIDLTSDGQSLSPEQQSTISDLASLPLAERTARLLSALQGKTLPPPADIIVSKVEDSPPANPGQP